MFDDDHVLSAQPPPDDLWKVVIKGHHQQDVEAFALEVQSIFAGLNPKFSAAEKQDDDLFQIIIQMKWNSVALEHMLEQMVPNHLEIQQQREAKKCQGQII